MSAAQRSRRGWRRRVCVPALGVVTLCAATVGALVPLTSHAATGGIHASGIQELDGSIDFTGNTTAYGTTAHDTAIETAPPYDWSSLFTGGSGGGGVITTSGAVCQVGSCAGLIADVGRPYTGDLFTKGSKDTNDVTQWSCTQQANPPKDQLVNTYAAAWTAQASAGSIAQNDTVMFAGLERPNTNGNSNAGFWLFRQSVLCNAATGQFVTTLPCGTSTTPACVAAGHSNGDLFMVGSFLSGGTNGVLVKYTWDCTPLSATDPTCANANGGLSSGTSGALNCPTLTSTTDTFCEVVNQSTSNTGSITNWTVDTPWSNISTGTAGIPGPGFLEMGIDLSQALGSAGVAAPCFASFLADTRSSGSGTNAETKDFINGSFPTCGSLAVHKYIDQNLNGAFDSGTDLNGSGWPMTVKNPSGTTICSGTTGSDGKLVCGSADRGLKNLPAGQYTVTETQKSGFYNTDPGTGSTCNDTAASSATPPDATDVNKSPSVSCTIQLNNGGSPTAQLGNQCLVSMTFTVTGIPSGTSGVVAHYTVTSGLDQSGTAVDVPLSPTGNGSTTYTGATAAIFVQNDVLSWTFSINGDPSHTETGATGVTMTNGKFNANGNGVTDCALTTTGAFQAGAIKALKYKDKDASGFVSGSTDSDDTLIGGFQFQLIALPSSTAVTSYPTTTCAANTVPTSACLYAPATSSSASGHVGEVNFTNVNPGYYQIHELVPSGWRQTGPTGTPPDYVVQVVLGSNVTVTKDTGGNTLIFLDTPTYHFGVTFNSDANNPGTSTSAANGTITCSPPPLTAPSPSSTPSASGNGTGSASYGSGTSMNATQTYTCTIAVSDP